MAYLRNTPRVKEYARDVFVTFGLINEQLLEETKCLVYLTHRKEDSKVKQVVKYYKRNKFSTERFYTEVGIMRRLRHPNIMTYEHTASFPDHHAMILPYCGKGALYNEIGKIPFDMVEHYFLQTVSAVNYLHYKHIVHRDIKLDNILVDDKHNIFLIDFDMSSSVTPGRPIVNRLAGTEPYLAPEMVNSPMGSYDGFKLDIYALGVVLYCLIFEKDVQDKEDYAAEIRSHNWVSPKDFYKNILQCMLDEDPDWRWDIQSLIAALGKAHWLDKKILKL